ncbi:hypothetical protein F5876DRAFT_62867 [Lentinula aff. lateritia]|uniref:Uncharacterized protein n=1 Tax=Lentinula aff. lateritia TaxID=2804960 RepID=A0ACC1UAE0_9AGAR|nr:hypothetical protein F5876DRAFT_62867 [Lentinula aff. lateritia]
MTSRVQKGGPVFRPLGRQKSRPTAPSQGAVPRPQSVVVEQEQSTSSLHPSTAPASFPGNGIGAAASAFSDESQAPKAVAIPIVASSASMPLPALNSVPSFSPSSSAFISQYGAPSSLPPPLAPIIPTAIPTPSQPHLRPQLTPMIPLIQSSSYFPPPSNVLHNSVTENASALPTPPSALNVESHPKTSQWRDANSVVEHVAQHRDPNENGEGAFIESTSKETTNKRKARSAKNTTADDDDGTAEPRPAKRRKQASKSKTTRSDDANGDNVQKPRRKRSRKTRSPSLPPFDPNADPGENIDPTVVTMALLCSDTGHGRVSSKAQEVLNNHVTWKASNRERRVRMKIMMERKKYGQPEDEDTPPEAPTTSDPAPVVPAAESSHSRQPSPFLDNAASTSSPAVAVNLDPDSFDYTQKLAVSRFNVQVRIGPNGETIIDEESLVVDRAGDTEDDTSGYTHVIESDRSQFTNSSTYGTKLRGTRWSAEETELFYEALSQYGENYELISYVMPGRDRKSCKNKFKAEDKKNSARINHCLNNSIPVDIETLSRMTGRDFSGPTPEITLPKPVEHVAPAVTAQGEADSSEGTSIQDRHRDLLSSSKSRKRSRSRTAGPPEEGLMVIGDLDTFVDLDAE